MRVVNMGCDPQTSVDDWGTDRGSRLTPCYLQASHTLTDKKIPRLPRTFFRDLLRARERLNVKTKAVTYCMKRQTLCEISHHGISVSATRCFILNRP